MTTRTFSRSIQLCGSLLFCSLLLSACSSGAPQSGNGTDADSNNPPPAPQSAECLAPSDAQMPASPGNGESRAGFSCGIHLKVLDLPNAEDIPGFENFTEADVVAFQVLEPATLEGGKTYPLIFDGHGFSGSRATSGSATGLAGLTVPTQPILDGGFGIISIDQGGHGETGGLIRIMDPDQEGRFLLAIMDWAEANLDWLAYGPEGGFTPGANEDPSATYDNPLMGAIGPSYGGGYQLLMHSIDPKKRLDVIVPQITWNDLSFSIFPGTVPKSAWGATLFAAGNTAGSELERANFDPFVQRAFAEALSQGRVTDEALDYFRYHGLGYFCDAGNTPLVTNTNGDNGSPLSAGDLQYDVDFAPTAPTKIHALFWQGMRDELFNFNEAFDNYSCLQPLGGDVRLLTYQSGHNTLQVPVDPMLLSHPTNALAGTCGPFDPTVGAIGFFNRYLKPDGPGTGINVDLDAVLPTSEQICMSLQGADELDQITDNGDRYRNNDYVLVNKDALPVGATNGTEFDGISITTLAGVTPHSAATVIQLPYDADTHGNILAGIPELQITITSPAADVIDPTAVVLFVAVATSDNNGVTWNVADNQILPVRGLSDEPRSIRMIGVGERLLPNTLLGISVMGLSDHFASQGSANPGSFAPVPVTVEGKVFMPLLDESAL